MSKEAMKLALEALKEAHDESLDDNHFKCRQILMGQIAALTAALEQPAQQEPVVKPYAYEYGRNNGDGTYSVVIEKGDLVQTAPAVYNYVRPRNAHKDWPIKELFDHPPAQRTWVGLTDDDLVDVVPESNTPMSLGEAFVKYGRAIEAKLKEKNT